MSWFTSILTSTYRYTVQLFNVGAVPIVALGKAIEIAVDFPNPQTPYQVDFLNPQAASNVDFQNPKTPFEVDFPNTGADGT